MLVNNYRRILVVAHRRSGKDVTAFNSLWVMALQRPGLYFHLLPKIGQSTTAIWKGRGKDGVAFLDYIPKQIVEKINNSDQTITLSNGSIIKVTGADNYEVLVGSNPMGIVFSEIQSTNPLAWSYLRPALTENGGWAIFIGTPRGHNHLYEMYNTNISNENWSTYKLAVNETTYDDGSPVITKEMLDEELASGMSKELFEQEYYCSFEGAIEGAYFTEQLKTAKEEKRICDFEINREFPVHTAWDIGVRDSTSIGFYQAYPDGSLRCIHHIEDFGKDAAYWVLEINKVKEELKFKRWGHHFLPHDVAVFEWGGGRTRRAVLQNAGIIPRTVKSGKGAAIERIQAIRSMFPKFWIRESGCKHLIRALHEYHSEYDAKRGIYSTSPAHNWASHAVDQLGCFAVGHMECYDNKSLQNVKRYASFTP